MIKSICSVFFVLSFAFCFSAQALSGGGGGMDIGGGSGLALLFRQYGFQVATLVGKTQNFPITQENFEKIVRTTRVELSEKPVLDSKGESVVALVRPESNLITLNIEKGRAIFFAPTSILPLIAHLYLEVAGFADQNNQVSNKLFKTRGVLSNIVCQTPIEPTMRSVETITFQEFDHDGDGIADIRNSVSYSRDVDNGLLMTESEPPLISKTLAGALLTYNSMNTLAAKIFLPQSFIENKSAEQDFNSYFVDLTPERETGIYTTFTCRHVEEETQSSTVNRSTAALSQSQDEDAKKIDDETLKSLTALWTKSLLGQANFVADNLHLLPNFPLSKKRFKELIGKVKIEITNDILIEPGGLEVDALNYPQKNLIRFNFFRVVFAGLKPKVALQLVVHEFLGLAKIPDPNYSVSSRVWSLPSIVKMEMTCERQIENGDKDQILYRLTDANGDGMDDSMDFFATRISKDGTVQNLQAPFHVIETTDEIKIDDIIAGYRIFWSSGEKTYSTYWTKQNLDKSTSFKADYNQLSENGYDRFEEPTGTMNCNVSRVPKFVY